MPGTRRAHYRGSYQTEARGVREAAYADPTTLCPSCGLTLEQRRATHSTATWDAGHVLDTTPGAPLVAQCSHCNRSQGARLGNAKRASGYDW